MRADELTTRHDAHTKVAAALGQWCTQTASGFSESDKVYSAAKDGENPVSRAKVNLGSENRSGASSIAA